MTADTIKNVFDSSFDSYACIGETISATVDGFEIEARIEFDEDAGSPWENSDCHGPVSEWTSRGKRPGERILATDGYGRNFRYYDFAEAIGIAKRDGWDAAPYGGKKGERANRAAEADYQALKAWCNDQWRYVGIVLSVSCKGVVLDRYAASLWGNDMNYPGSDNSHLTEVANELLSEALEVGKAKLSELCSA